MSSTLLQRPASSGQAEQIEARPESLYDKCGRSLRARTFFFGVVLGFLVCVVLGYAAPQRWPIRHFQRLHEFINDATDFYPTVSQMLVIVRHNAPPDKILVLIGGGSLSWGFGQSPARLWSDRLQQSLGDSYAVVNLAMNGHGAFESSYVVFEKLRHEYKRAIFVTSGTPIIPLDVTEKRIPRGAYLFYDALFKGYLDAFATRSHPPIPRSLRSKIFEGDQRQEAVIAGTLDSVCRFQDLWTSVAYQYFSTIWTRPTRAKIWLPRKEFSDSHGDRWHKTTVNPTIMAQAKHDVETYVRRIFYERGRLRDPERVSAELSRAVQHLIPQYVRPQVIYFVFGMSPLYLRELNQTDRQLFELRWNIMSIYRRAGYNLVDMTGQLQETDYCDVIHLTPDGGNRFAAMAADAIRRQTATLGYIDNPKAH